MIAGFVFDVHVCTVKSSSTSQTRRRSRHFRARSGHGILARTDVRREVHEGSSPAARDRSTVGAAERRLSGKRVGVAGRGGLQRRVVWIEAEARRGNQRPGPAVHADVHVPAIKSGLGRDPVVEREARRDDPVFERNRRRIEVQHAALIAAGGADPDAGVGAKNPDPLRSGSSLTHIQSRAVNDALGSVRRGPPCRHPLEAVTEDVHLRGCRASHRSGVFLERIGWKLHCAGGVRSSTASAACATCRAIALR